MKKFILTLLVMLAAPMSAFAGKGHLGTSNVDTELRTLQSTLRVQLPAKGTDTTSGLGGVLMSADAHGLTNLVMTSTIGGMPYPAKLAVGFNDGGSATTTQLSCTSVTIKGIDSKGRAKAETLSTVNETVQYTTNVFESVSQISATGCNGGGGAGGDSSDLFFVGTSKYVGLPFKITAAAAVVMVCLIDKSDSDKEYCMKPAASDAATSFDNSGSGSRVDVAAGTFDVGTAFTSVTAASGDQLVIRVRAPAGIY